MVLLTSKGTTTIPVEIRRNLGVEPGMYVSFIEDRQTGKYVLERPQSISELRHLNKKALAKAGTKSKVYQSGYGFTAHVIDKYGS
jgi:bifunctional DNA-binding transcriptional regulator/antitoxin component of YhaV-PrlF toxin-antitoxin module